MVHCGQLVGLQQELLRSPRQHELYFLLRQVAVYVHLLDYFVRMDRDGTHFSGGGDPGNHVGSLHSLHQKGL